MLPEQTTAPVEPVRETVRATPGQGDHYHHYHGAVYNAPVTVNRASDAGPSTRQTVIRSNRGSWLIPALLIIIVALMVGYPTYVGGYHYLYGKWPFSNECTTCSAMPLLPPAEKSTVAADCSCDDLLLPETVAVVPETRQEPVVIKTVYRTKVINRTVVVRHAPPQLPVEEVQDNLPDAHCSTCNMYHRLNDSDEVETPVITRRRKVYEAESFPQLKRAPASGVVCVSVLQGEPSALVLRDGPDNTGGAIIGWKPSTIGWYPTSRGYVGRVCFPASIIENRDVVTLCGAENHSTFRRSHINELLSRRKIPASDPACLLGKWECARYGL